MKILGCMLAACVTLAPLRAAGPEFEVASVRPSPEITPELIRSGKLNMGMTLEHGRFNIAGMPLSSILQAAFRTRVGQITGPDWIGSERFDIAAKIPDGAAEDQVPEMLQALLADRFKLTVHRETKDQPAYALVVAKGGIKAKEIAADAEVPSLAPAGDSAVPVQTQVVPFGGSLIRATQTPDGSGVISGPNFPGIRITQKGGPWGMHLDAPKLTCAQLALLLTELVNRQVVDMTGTKASYQFSLDVAMPDRTGTPEAPSSAMGEAIIAAVQKLGLRLDSRKLPTEMIVVDHLEKIPSEN